MLAKHNRITESKDFLRIFKTVRPVHTDHFAIRVVKRTNKLPQRAPLGAGQATSYKLSRFGFVVSNKIDKRAARRNGLKRRIRAVVRQKLPEITGGFDVVIQAKKPLDYPYNFNELEQEVIEGIKRAGLLK